MCTLRRLSAMVTSNSMRGRPMPSASTNDDTSNVVLVSGPLPCQAAFRSFRMSPRSAQTTVGVLQLLLCQTGFALRLDEQVHVTLSLVCSDFPVGEPEVRPLECPQAVVQQTFTVSGMHLDHGVTPSRYVVHAHACCPVVLHPVPVELGKRLFSDRGGELSRQPGDLGPARRAQTNEQSQSRGKQDADTLQQAATQTYCLASHSAMASCSSSLILSRISIIRLSLGNSFLLSVTMNSSTARPSGLVVTVAL
eukprot:scaffold874_cov380-Prasinococcus_capsulatus_cf.AAC.11